MPSRFDEPIKYELCREAPLRFMNMRIDQGIDATVYEGLHERMDHADWEIEIGHLGRRLFEYDEVENVRVVDMDSPSSNTRQCVARRVIDGL